MRKEKDHRTLVVISQDGEVLLSLSRKLQGPGQIEPDANFPSSFHLHTYEKFTPYLHFEALLNARRSF
jgi:hypothetical protein